MPFTSYLRYSFYSIYS